jgi:ABC-type branched-subunit amino acid transport system substrate-binding protein
MPGPISPSAMNCSEDTYANSAKRWATTQKKPRYIETVATRGYRLLLRVELEAPSSTANASTQAPLLERKRVKSQRELRVGILHSLTGTMAWTERPVVDATLLAIDEVNERGGILETRGSACGGRWRVD